MSRAKAERNLLEYIPVEEIYKLRDRLEQELSLRFGTIYNGYLGVDMMICRFPGSPVYRIHPCVEINLRMNMGVVARHIYAVSYTHLDVYKRQVQHIHNRK